MNTKSLAVLLALFAGPTTFADEATLRYHLTGGLQLEMEQEIFVASREDAVAGRIFSMDFAIGEVGETGEQPVELTKLRASYTAHGMNQRLPASHLLGTSFALSGDERLLTAEGTNGEINLGQVTDGGLVPGRLLAGFLPVLPAESLSMGSTWVSEQAIETLEGWSWAGGDILFENEVTAMSESDGALIVTVQSIGRATLHAAEGREGFVGEGELERSVEWSFDATTGMLLNYSLMQESSGTSQLPQGEVPVRQFTRVELQEESGVE